MTTCSDPGTRRALCRHRARPCHARISQQAGSRAERPRRRAASQHAASDLLRQLRLAFLRPWPLAAGDPLPAIPASRSRGHPRPARQPVHAGEGGGRVGLSVTAEQPGVRAALWLGVALDAGGGAEAAIRRDEGRAWSAALRPLAEAFAERFPAYPAQAHPTRSAPAPMPTPPSPWRWPGTMPRSRMIGRWPRRSPSGPIAGTGRTQGAKPGSLTATPSSPRR